MLTDRQTPWPGATYNGFSDAPARDSGPARKAARVPTRGLLLGGIAAAVGLGLAFGLATRPDFGDDGRAREPMRAVTAPAAVDAPAPVASQFEIEVNQPTPPPAPVGAGKLEVLPPDLARAAPKPTPAYSAPPRARVAAAPPRIMQIPAPPPAVQAIAPRPAPAPAVAPPRYAAIEPQARPSFNCRYARTPSERMVCGDEDLAAADRRLARAYDRAIAAGVPARALRAEQDDWLSIRDDAARRSPDAVASVYEQRIGELEELADSF